MENSKQYAIDKLVASGFTAEQATGLIDLLYEGFSGTLSQRLNEAIVVSDASFVPDTIPPDGP